LIRLVDDEVGVSRNESSPRSERRRELAGDRVEACPVADVVENLAADDELVASRYRVGEEIELDELDVPEGAAARPRGRGRSARCLPDEPPDPRRQLPGEASLRARQLESLADPENHHGIRSRDAAAFEEIVGEQRHVVEQAFLRLDPVQAAANHVDDERRVAAGEAEASGLRRVVGPAAVIGTVNLGERSSARCSTSA
jgi:hypothetical protein